MWSLLGIALSAGWLAFAYLWFDREIGLDNLSYVLLPEVVGQYVAGLLAPLILIWVLMGYLRGPRGLGSLRAEIATLRDELAERARQDAARPRPEAPAARRPLEPVLSAPAAAPPPPASAPSAPAPKAPPPLAAPRIVPAPATTPAPLGPVPPAAPTLAEAAPAAAPAEAANVTSLAQEVARTLGRLASDPPPAAALEGEAAQDEEFRQLTHKVGRDLNAICMDLSAVLCRKSARDEALKAYNRGHKEAFHVLVRDYLSRHDPAEIMVRLTQADAQTLLHTYAMKFASLIDEAGRRDASGVQEQALRGSAMGQLYEEVQRHTQLARAASRP